MHVKTVTPIIATDKLDEVKAFYTQYLGFEVTYDGEWYLSMHAPNNKALSIDFMRPNSETQPPVFQTCYQGKGAFLAIEVDDVDGERDRLKAAGVDIAVALKDDDWGQRHFAILDPAGVAIDIFKWIPATAEYTASYVA